MKLLLAGATVVAAGVLTAGCSSGSGTKAAAPSTAGATSAAAAAAASTSAAAAPVATTAQPAAASQDPASPPTTGPASASAQASASAVAASSGPTSSGPTSSGPTSATAGGNAAPVAVCTTLPTAQVASLSGVTLTSSREQDFAGDNDYTCDYNTAAGFGGLSVTVAVVGGAAQYAGALSTDMVSQSVEHVTPVTGLGDKAFSARDGLRALFGDRLIYVAGLTSVPPAEAIIKAVQAKLP